jgi:hypothetical protein
VRILAESSGHAKRTCATSSTRESPVRVARESTDACKKHERGHGGITATLPARRGTARQSHPRKYPYDSNRTRQSRDAGRQTQQQHNGETQRADAPAPAAAGAPTPAAGEPSRTSKEARWRRHRAPGKRSKGARTWFSTDPRSTKWLGIGSGGDSAAPAPGETAGASTAASARDSPAPVAAGPPAPAARKPSRTTKEARWRRQRAPTGRAARGSEDTHGGT